MDGKHTIFGKLVGGLDTLNEMEKIEVDNKDCPIEDIIIQKVEVFVNPFQEAEEELAREREDEAIKQAKEIAQVNKNKRINQKLKVFRDGVGKYLDLSQFKSNTNTSTSTEVKKEPALKKIKLENFGGFGDFKSWN